MDHYYSLYNIKYKFTLLYFSIYYSGNVMMFIVYFLTMKNFLTNQDQKARNSQEHTYNIPCTDEAVMLVALDHSAIQATV